MFSTLRSAAFFRLLRKNVIVSNRDSFIHNGNIIIQDLRI